MPPVTTEEWAKELAAKKPLHLDPKSKISIKRDVHNVIVGADATSFIKALHEALMRPGQWFGLIEILRPPDRMGKPFEVGDRLQGKYSIEKAIGIDQGDDDSDDGFFEKLLEKTLSWIEDETLSDYGLVTVVDLDPATAPDGVARFKYIYLEGTPIAGATTFEVVPIDDKSCCFRSIFEYQELNFTTALMFGTYGLKLHNQVIIAEADIATKALGVDVIWMDIPAEYRVKPDDDSD